MKIIGGFKNNKHLICNKDSNKFEDHWIFEEGNSEYNNCMYWVGLVYIQSKRELLLFGGLRLHEDFRKDIYRYSFQDKKWVLLSYKLPIAMELFGYILTFDEKYILIFGGYTGQDEFDTIYIWDLQNMRFKKSEICCPIKDGFLACITAENIEPIVVNGFIRKYIEIDPKIVPQDIIQLIWNWCSDCFVHLISREDKKHWKIDINKILTNA